VNYTFRGGGRTVLFAQCPHASVTRLPAVLVSSRSTGLARAANLVGATFDSVSGRSKRLFFHVLLNMPFYLIGVI
jgi:hypothetical protein